MILISTILTVVALVSSQTGCNQHVRYLLPVFPLLCVWCGKVGRAFECGCGKLGVVIVSLLAWSVGSSLWAYPHGLSYFNELVGGPTNGHYHLLHSNTDWGQDLFFLKRWLDEHAEARPIGLSFAGIYSPRALGIEYEVPPGWPSAMRETSAAGDVTGPQPGWYAISVNHLHDPQRGYEYFLEIKRFATAGYSTYIYHVTLSEANRLRRKSGLPELPADWGERRKRYEEYRMRLVSLLAESASSANICASSVRVAVLNCEEAGDESWKTFTEILRGMRCQPVFPGDVQSGALQVFDVLVVPGGSGTRYAEVLGDRGRATVRKFVGDGGGYVGICAGAFLATSKYDWGLAIINAKTITGEVDIPGVGRRSLAVRGEGSVRVELTDAGKSIVGEFPRWFSVKYVGGPIFSRAGRDDLAEYVPLGIYRTETWDYEAQRGTMIDSPAIIAGSFDKGRVIIFSPHPEMTKELQLLVQRAVMATATLHKADRHRIELD